MTTQAPETLIAGDVVEFKLAPGAAMTVEKVNADGSVDLVWFRNDHTGPFRQTVLADRLRRIGRGRHLDRPTDSVDAAVQPSTVSAGFYNGPLDTSFDSAPAAAPETTHHDHSDSYASPSPSPADTYSAPDSTPDYSPSSSPDSGGGYDGGGFDGGGGGDFGGGGSSGDF